MQGWSVLIGMDLEEQKTIKTQYKNVLKTKPLTALCSKGLLRSKAPYRSAAQALPMLADTDRQTDRQTGKADRNLAM